ncbi:zinc-finger homeodomain protein 12-like [Prosopis cineraria]|uniref:zinc-finger homeodomain protein 12-like n=1 Tax=Prosopis cineraria TaxID=364024 RepID=UPI00240F003C|nr:zinc-finger homeodomain protein 12-like [Prosopis cineraria]
MSGIDLNVPATFKQEVLYKECLRNHAASLGHVANDGCYEFLKPRTDNTVDGGSQDELFCAVCKCHRNFHRKQVVYTPIMEVDVAVPQTTHQQPNFLTTTGGGPSADDINNNNTMEEPAVVPPLRRRRKTTMITAEQQSRPESLIEE